MTSAPNASFSLDGLRAGEVHVWLSIIEDNAALERKLYREQLSEKERERADKMASTAGRLEFVVAHALLRALLSRYHPVDPLAWQFDRGPDGKPFISAPADAPPLQFSLTHTRGLAACGVAWDAAIGVDAEFLEARDDLLGVARQFLPAAATSELENLSGTKRVLCFYEHWTRQEAWAKAAGIGLAGLPISAEDPVGWQFFQEQIPPNYILAAAVCRTGLVLKLKFTSCRERDGRLVGF